MAAPSALVIAVEDPGVDDVRAMVERHLATMHATSPPEHVFALGIEQLADAGVTVFGARRDGRLVAIGALQHLDTSHAELKSMHTAVEARGQGVGAAMLAHLLGVARDRGYDRVSLETGSMDEFEPARALYRRVGFVPCGPFADYRDSAVSTFMTLHLG